MGALISWRNLADSAALTLTSGWAAAGFPASNLLLRGLAARFMSEPAGPGSPLTIQVDNLAMTYARRDPAFAPTANSVVTAIAIQSDGKIIIGGSFTTVGGVARNRMARLNADGSLDTAFNPNANNQIRAIALQPDGKILVGGDFTTVGGVARNRMARLNADGALDTTFDPGANGTVRAIALQPDGKILVGGDFTTVGGVARNRMARLNADGALDTAFNPNASAPIFAIAVRPDGKILVGGNFTTIGGYSRNRFALLTTTGTADTAFTANANAQVEAIALRSDGWAYVGGDFTTLGSYTRNRIARVSEYGDVDTTFSPVVVGKISAIAELPAGGVVIGGQVSTVNGVISPSIARLESDGTLDQAWVPGVTTGAVNALAAQSGAVLIGCSAAASGYLLRLRTVSPRSAHFVALLDVRQPAGYTGTVTIQSRPSLSAAWATIGTADMGTFREGAEYLPAHVIIPLPAGTPASSQFRITPGNSETAPFGFGRLWIGDALELPDGIDGGWSMGFRDSGSLDATDGQQWVETKGVRTRVMSIPLEGARETEIVWGFRDDAEIVTNAMPLFALQLEAGVTGEVVAIARTSSSAWMRASSVYGHIEQPWSIGHKAGPYWGGTLTVIEER